MSTFDGFAEPIDTTMAARFIKASINSDFLIGRAKQNALKRSQDSNPKAADKQ
jgi:hypothetical protein